MVSRHSGLLQGTGGCWLRTQTLHPMAWTPVQARLHPPISLLTNSVRLTLFLLGGPHSVWTNLGFWQPFMVA